MRTLCGRSSNQRGLFSLVAMKMRPCGAVFIALAFAFSLAAAPAGAAPAPNANSVLILDSTVTSGASSLEAQAATIAGFTVVVVNATQWAAMTQADFASYRAIILGDPTCVTGTAPIAAAEANAMVWGPAVNGNVFIIGTDPTYHAKTNVINNAVAFAASDPAKTGAYITLSCYYHGTAPGTAVPLLNGLGSFTTTGLTGCFDAAHIVVAHPALTGLVDADLANWSCSVHEAFEAWPASFQVLALALEGNVFTAGDGTTGTPYIMARGEQLVTLGLSLQPLNALNFVGTNHTVTATLTDAQTGGPQVGVQLGFKILSGPNAGASGTCVPANCVTDNNGQVTFTYTGLGGPGQDAIIGWADTIVVNGLPDQGEPQVTAAKDWIIPETTTTTMVPTTTTLPTTTTSSTTTSTTSTTTSTTTTLSVCGDSVISGGEECDDGNNAAGDGCDDNCLVEVCWTCAGTPSVCTALDAVACDDGDVCTTGDTCQTGSCVGTEVLVRSACDWVVVAGDPARRVQVKTKQPSQVLGDICGDRAMLGEETINGGDIAVTESTFRNAIRFGEGADVVGDIVTGGGGVRGRPRGTLLPGLAIDEVTGGNVQAKDPLSDYDTTGSHPQVAACQLAQDGIDTAGAALLGLSTTVSVGKVKVPRGTSITIAPGTTPGVVAGAVNVVEFESLTIATDGTILLDAGGNAATVYVIRVLGKFSMALRSSVVLAGGQLAENVIFHGDGKKCHLGLRVTGSGVVICPNAKVKLNALAVWDGAMLSGKGKAFIGEGAILTHQPFFGL